MKIFFNSLRIFLLVLADVLLLFFWQFFLPFPASAQTPSLQPTPQPTAAPTLIFSEDFSHGLTQWQLARGHWEYWQLQDGWLEADLRSPFAIAELLPQPEVWPGLSEHYVYEFDFQVLTGEDRNWAWGYVDRDNWYEAHWRFQRLHVVRLQQGQEQLNFYEDYSLQPHQSYHVRLEHDAGHLQLWVDEDLVLDRQDQTYDGQLGRIVLKATTGASWPSRVRYDNIQVWNYAAAGSADQEKILPVLEFKQGAVPWGNQVYDQAEDWVDPEADADQLTIKRWGCALSSLAMILHYHGLQFLPDGQELNPGTLNAWLRAQADGYIAGGVNWLAGSRLSRLLAEQARYESNGQIVLPKLEYHRIFSPSIAEVVALLQEQRPGILQIPGHFLIANGYTADESDLHIVDPAYAYDYLSQHQLEEPAVLSVGDYQPSQTDLSYVLLVYKPNLSIEFVDDEGLALAEQFLTYDTVQDAVDSLQPLSPGVIRHYLPQPEDGNYQFKIFQVADENGELETDFADWQMFFYDEQAEVRQQQHQEFFAADLSGQSGQGSEPIFLNLHFNKQDLTDIQLTSAAEPDFVLCADVLAAAMANDELQHCFVADYLQFLLTEINNFSQTENLSLVEKERFRQVVIDFLAEKEELINQDFLLEMVKALN